MTARFNSMDKLVLNRIKKNGPSVCVLLQCAFGDSPLPPHPEPLQFPGAQQPVQRVLPNIQQIHDLLRRQVLADGLPLVQAVVIIIIVHGFTPFRPISGLIGLFDVIPVFPNDTLFKRTSAEPGVSLRLRVLRMFLFLAGKTERTSGIQKSAAIFPKN